MTTTATVTVSLDGYVAGPDQSLGDPLGRGGEALHRWMFADPMHPVDQRWRDRILRPGVAYVMGRNMFGPVRGPWETWTGEQSQGGREGEWRGWWGEDPPYHAPVFVLTHHEREPLEMAGGTTFHFVTTGFADALRRAREASGGEVDVAGGASTIRQAIAAGALDELTLNIRPVLLGAGERLFDGTIDPRLEQVEGEASALATHVRYRLG